MKHWLLTLCIFAFCAISVNAQRPKLTLRVFAGPHTHTFVYKEDPNVTDRFGGWQAAFGLRVTWRKLMGEIDFSFVRNKVLIPLPDSLGLGNEVLAFQLRSFELPLKAGFNFVKTPVFKWWGYTGVAVRFNTKGILDYQGEEYEFKPKDVMLANPNVDWIIGTQFDLAWFTFDLMYSLGVNNALKENIRSNSHELQLSVGLWF